PGPRPPGTRPAGQPLTGPRRRDRRLRALIPRRSEISEPLPKRGRLLSLRGPSLRSGVQTSLGLVALVGEGKGQGEHLMRLDRGANGDLRQSALWGKPSKGETR